ncbi:MAG: hypothetical protein ACTHJK_04260 [Sphingomicrobium sp.]
MPTDASLGRHVRSPFGTKGPICVERRTWIGLGVVILPDVTIGERSIVCAGSVVTRDVLALSSLQATSRA